MNSRRLKLSIWLPSASRRRSVYPSLNLTRRGQEVLGADLNCSESKQETLPTPPVSIPMLAGDRCTAGFQPHQCPLWVKSGGDHQDDAAPYVRFAPKADKRQASR